MTVADLQKLLSNLAETLAAAGAGKRSVEVLNYLCEKLQPFRSQGLREFGDFLDRARTPSGTAPAKKPAGGIAKDGKDLIAVQRATEKVKALYERFRDPTLTREVVEAGVREISGLSKLNLETVGQSIGIVRKYPRKDDVIRAIVQTIMDRKGAYERASV